jgi:hypothetical protein
MRFRHAVAVACAALTTAACSGGAEHPAGPPSPARQQAGIVIDEAPARPLPVRAAPLWSKNAKSVGGVVLRGDAVIVESTGGNDEDRLTVMDAATGKVRWSVNAYGPLRGGGGATWGGPARSPGPPHVVGDGAAWGILVGYYATSCRSRIGFCPVGDGPSDETGVALVSGADGRVRWKTPLVPSRTGDAARAANRMRGSLITADGTIALATVLPSAQSADVRLIALDAATGRRLWTRSGVQPTLIAGGIVLGRVRTGATTATDLRGWSVIALDAPTGRVRWDLTARLPDSYPMLAAAGAAAIRQVNPSGTLGPPRLVDLRTGGEIARLPEFTADCRTDGQTLIACRVSAPPHDRLLTIGPDHVVRTAKRDLTSAADLAAVWRSHIFLNDGIEVDRSANRLAAGLPGAPAALSDRYAIFTRAGSAATRYSAHRLP